MDIESCMAVLEYLTRKSCSSQYRFHPISAKPYTISLPVFPVYHLILLSLSFRPPLHMKHNSSCSKKPTKCLRGVRSISSSTLVLSLSLRPRRRCLFHPFISHDSQSPRYSILAPNEVPIPTPTHFSHLKRVSLAISYLLRQAQTQLTSSPSSLRRRMS